MFRADAVCDQFAARDLWRHCVAAGVAARLLANAVHLPQVDEAFVAGLVHDVGLIVAQQLFPAKLREVATACLSNPQDFCATGIAVIGADHQALGWALASRWKFPPPRMRNRSRRSRLRYRSFPAPPTAFSTSLQLSANTGF